jgi:hypothetical protein
MEVQDLTLVFLPCLYYSLFLFFNFFLKNLSKAFSSIHDLPRLLISWREHVGEIIYL